MPDMFHCIPCSFCKLDTANISRHHQYLQAAEAKPSRSFLEGLGAHCLPGPAPRSQIPANSPPAALQVRCLGLSYARPKQGAGAICLAIHPTEVCRQH